MNNNNVNNTNNEDPEAKELLKQKLLADVSQATVKLVQAVNNKSMTNEHERIYGRAHRRLALAGLSVPLRAKYRGK
jgi:hypothetical protein